MIDENKYIVLNASRHLFELAENIGLICLEDWRFFYESGFFSFTLYNIDSMPTFRTSTDFFGSIVSELEMIAIIKSL